jgi:DNA gyrase subunit A
VRDFDDVRQLVMATRNGVVKKTPLSAYARPQRGGIIAARLDEGDELIGVAIANPGDDLLLATAQGKAIRFDEADVRSMGRNTRGVKGITLREGDHVVAMVVADPAQDLLTLCLNGYGKRTPIGPAASDEEEAGAAAAGAPGEATPDAAQAPAAAEGEAEEEAESEEASSTHRYRRQKRGGYGIVNIKTTSRNGPVVVALAVAEGDEVLMVTALGKIQRIRVDDVSRIGRNTQGVTIIRLDDNDELVTAARVPSEEIAAAAARSVPAAGGSPRPAAAVPRVPEAGEADDDGRSSAENDDDE